MPKFDLLPFTVRPDLSPFLLHFTKRSKGKKNIRAFDNLCHILQTGKIYGSDKEGFVKGPNKASCFMDVPFMSLKYVFTENNTKSGRPRYEPYGIMVTKQFAYKNGARPVLYLSDKEISRLKIPRNEWWRVVKLDVDKSGNWISWLHEREWRKKGDFSLPSPTSIAVLVKTSKEAKILSELIKKKKYKCKPRSVIPLGIVCQGLPRK